MDAGDHLVEWGVERATELVDLAAGAWPDDKVSLDEIQACCWRSDSIVLGCVDGSGAVAVTVGADGDTAVVEILAFGDDRDSARGPALVDAAISHARHQRVSEIVFGGSMPGHLRPGVGSDDEAAGAALAAAGFARVADVGIVSVPTTLRIESARWAVERVVDDGDAESARIFVAREFPHWQVVVDAAIDQATLHVAVDPASGTIVGVGAHSVGRDGWIGPVGVGADARRERAAAQLVAASCRDLMIAGLTEAPLAWMPTDDVVGDDTWPSELLALVGAHPWRSFARWRLALADPGLPS